MKKLLFPGLCLVIILSTVFYLSNKADNKEFTRIPGAYKALELFTFARAYPFSDIPSAAYSLGFEQHLKLRQSSSHFKSKFNSWRKMGPLNTAGRALSLSVNPLDPNTIYMCSASGGLWRSRELGLGQSWEYMPTGFPVLGVSCLEFPENDSMTMYIGTGEVYNFFDTGTDGAYRSTRGSYGIGILKSEDGGRSWEKSLDWSYQQNHGVWMIKVSRQNPDIVYAATTQGIYKSTDAGDTWERVLDVIMATDIEIDPRDDNKVIASFGNFGTSGRGIYRTVDGGVSWMQVPPTSWFSFQGKILLARSGSNPDVVYASVGNGFGFNDGATWLLKSVDNGRNWNTINKEDYSKWQGWFSHDIAVHPENENEIIAVGIDIYKSTDGGESLVQKTGGGVSLGIPPIEEPDGNPNYSHSDHHFVVYHPELDDIVLFGNDGGLFISFDGGETVRSANGGLQTTQFYNGFSISESDTTFAMGGLQDNSTVIFRGDGAWQRAIGGDGSWSAINQRDDNIVFGSYQNLNILKSLDNGGSFFQSGIGFVGDESPLFISPYVISDSEPPVMYAGGRYVYKSEDLAVNWEVTNERQKLNGDPVFAMDVSDMNPDIVYAATAPEVDVPRVFSSTDGGRNWNMSSTDLPDRIPNDIAVHPFDPAMAYVCFSGFGTDHLYRTLNYGVSWSPIGNGLPDVPTNAIAIDPSDPSIIYVGNDIAVYVSTDGGRNFEVFGSDLPDAVIAMDLVVRNSDRKLWLATHGNGAYLTDLLSSTVSTTETGRDLTQINVFPNPASDRIYIRLNELSKENFNWKLYDKSGRMLLKGQETELDVSGIIAGTYILNIVSAESQVSRIVNIIN